MAAEAAIANYTTKSPLLPPSMSLVYTVIGADIADLPNAIGKDSLVGAQVRDLIKSILRGVYDFNKVMDQSLWYPDPAKQTPGATLDSRHSPINACVERLIKRTIRPPCNVHT